VTSAMQGEKKEVGKKAEGSKGEKTLRGGGAEIGRPTHSSLAEVDTHRREPRIERGGRKRDDEGDPWKGQGRKRKSPSTKGEMSVSMQEGKNRKKLHCMYDQGEKR